MLGFACYDATAKGLFGSADVSEEARGQGVGGALLLICLYGMKEEGYAYAVVGAVGPVDFYQKLCNATIIEGSSEGVFKAMYVSGV